MISGHRADAHGDRQYAQERAVFAQHDILLGDGRREEQLIRLHTALLRKAAHGQDGDRDEENVPDLVQCGGKEYAPLKQVQDHEVDAGKGQQRRHEYPARQGVEIRRKFSFQDGFHTGTSLSCAVVSARCSRARALAATASSSSVSSRNASSSVPARG